MIEPLYPFNLTAEQEAHARSLHDEMIIIDMLFQGPIGTYSLPEDFEEESLAMAQEHTKSEIDQVMFMSDYIWKQFIQTGGRFEQLYRDCWYESGITAGNRQLSVSSREDVLTTALQNQWEFDSKPWLIKATRPEHIRKAKADGNKAGIVTCQETEGFGKDLKLLELAYNFGLRVIQLTYNNHNLVGAGCMEPNNAGLSSFGIKFVQKCNELGITVDTGHCGKQTTLDACKFSTKPVIASHTACEEVYFHNRAKSDEEIRAIAATGGVIGIFSMPWFIAADPANTTVEHLLDHIDHVVKVAGIDHVGIGTDWPMPQTKWQASVFKKYVAPTMGFAPGDGPSVEWVHGVKDYRSFINITRGLMARGYSDEDIKKVMGENWMRVFEQTW